VVAGAIGGAGRLNFSVIGDVVNVAARVEAATRETGDGLLLTAETRDRLTRSLPLVRGRGALKGREEPIELFAPGSTARAAPSAARGRADGVKPVHVGCSGWNYDDWRGRFYPRGLPPRRWLGHYSSVFGTVEVNATFYRLPTREAVAAWIEQTPPGFVFSLKASRYQTHVKRLADMGQGVARYYERIEPLLGSPKLGPGGVAAAAELPPRRRSPGRRAGGAAGGPPLLRVPPRQLVRGRGVRAAALARRRARHRGHAGTSVPDARDDRRLDARALPPRRPRPARQLFGRRDCGRGRAGSRSGAAVSRSSPTSTTTGRASLPATR
jgi:hypothetical protein